MTLTTSYLLKSSRSGFVNCISGQSRPRQLEKLHRQPMNVHCMSQEIQSNENEMHKRRQLQRSVCIYDLAPNYAVTNGIALKLGVLEYHTVHMSAVAEFTTM